MGIVTVNINSSTKRGKNIIELLREMAKSGDDIKIAHTPNSETIEAINDARQRKGMKASSVDDLFEQLNS
jgi:3-dehydroquinate dehydratase